MRLLQSVVPNFCGGVGYARESKLDGVHHGTTSGVSQPVPPLHSGVECGTKKTFVRHFLNLGRAGKFDGLEFTAPGRFFLFIANYLTTSQAH